MDEFSPGFLSEKSSNVFKKSAKKVQLKADVKLRIKQRLLRDKGNKNRNADNHTGNASPFENYQEPKISLPAPNHNSTMKTGSIIAKVAEKLWRMKRSPYLHNEKFVFAGRVPCFLKRNIRKVDRNKRGRFVRSTKRKKKRNEYLSVWQRGKPARNPNATKEFYFRFKHQNAKRPASGRIENGQAKRLCLEPGRYEAMADGKIAKSLAKIPRMKSVNARMHLASGKIANDQAKEICLEPEYNEDTSNANTNPKFFEPSHKEKEISPRRSQSRNGSHGECTYPQAKPSFKKFQGASNENAQKRSFQRNRVPKSGSSGERNAPKTGSSFKECGGKTSQKNFSQTDCKEANNEQERSGIFRRNKTSGSSNEDRRKVFDKESCLKTLRVSLIDCFANGLHARENLTGSSFRATSTPKAIRVPPKNSQDVPLSRTASRGPTSHISPRVPTSELTPKITPFIRSPRFRGSHINPKIPTSGNTPRVVTSQMTSMLPSSQMTPPESEVSCTEDEEFERRKRGGLNRKNNNKPTSGGITYQPLFSNKPRPWKSVVVENDD